MKSTMASGLLMVLGLISFGCGNDGSIKKARVRAAIGTSQDAVFGSDDRKKLTDMKFPYTAIGRVQFGPIACTGTLVGPRHVLTATHCLVWDENGELIEGQFTPAYNNGSAPFGTAKVVDAQMYKDFKINTLVGGQIKSVKWDTKYFAFDMTLLTLDTEIAQGTGWLGTYPTKTYMEDRAIFSNVGYPQDVGGVEVPYYTENCKIDAVESKDWDGASGTQVRSKCDTYAGNSGGPLFFTNYGLPYVTAVVSGQVVSNWGWLPGVYDSANYFAGGNGLVELVARGLAATQDTDLINYANGTTAPGVPQISQQ